MMSKFLNKVMFVVMLIFMLNLGGCSVSVAGTYRSQENNSDYLELRSDNTFFVKESSSSFSGKYRVDKGILTLELPSGFSVQCKIDGNTIIDDENEKWVK